MKNNNPQDKITVEVLFHAESTFSYGVYVDKSPYADGWSRLEWLTKAHSVLTKKDSTPYKQRPSYFLTAPRWLLDLKNVKYKEDEDKI
jgi:hypothetical protein